MTRKTVTLNLSNDQLADLVNALEDHRDSFKDQAEQAKFGFGLGSDYWQGRVEEIQQLLDMVRQSVAAS